MITPFTILFPRNIAYSIMSISFWLRKIRFWFWPVVYLLDTYGNLLTLIDSQLRWNRRDNSLVNIKWDTKVKCSRQCLKHSRLSTISTYFLVLVVVVVIVSNSINSSSNKFNTQWNIIYLDRILLAEWIHYKSWIDVESSFLTWWL